MPFPLSVNDTPVGSAPLSDKLGAGVPVAVTVKLPALPTTNEAVSTELIVGAAGTVSVKDCVAFGVVPFAAVIVIG